MWTFIVSLSYPEMLQSAEALKVCHFLRTRRVIKAKDHGGGSPLCSTWQMIGQNCKTQNLFPWPQAGIPSCVRLSRIRIQRLLASFLIIHQFQDTVKAVVALLCHHIGSSMAKQSDLECPLKPDSKAIPMARDRCVLTTIWKWSLIRREVVSSFTLKL